MKTSPTIHVYLEQLNMLRGRTLSLLDNAVAAGGEAALGWRPGPGRAHIAWQLVHIGVTEEVFATERLFSQPPAFPDLIARFRGGSTPDDDIPSPDLIRNVLAESRQHLVNALSSFSEADLEVIPEAFRERNWTLRNVLQILAFHEPHHQGQAHLTLNLYKATLPTK